MVDYPIYRNRTKGDKSPPKPLTDPFTVLMRGARIEMGYTLNHAAELIGCPTSTLSNLELNGTDPRFSLVVRAAIVYDLSLEEVAVAFAQSRQAVGEV